MGATEPITLIPYPVLTDTADVPRDIKAVADRLEALLTGLYTPDHIRIKLTGAISGFGAGIYTGLSGFSTDITKGAAGAYTHSAGVITVNQGGQYAITADISTTVASGSYIEAKIANTAATIIYAHGVGPTGDTIVNLSTVRYLASGSTLQLFLYNQSGTLSASVDSGSVPFGMTVTRLPGSS